MKISVLTPSYNSGKYISRAIESVLQQEYKNVEHIVMDGGSTDGTVEILKRYPQLIWASERDNGQADAMNKAFNKSTGDLIVYLNADDWFDVGVFDKVIAAFNNTDAPMVIGNGTMVFDGQEETTPWISSSTYQHCLQHYRYSFPLNPCTYFYKREVQQQVPFNPRNHFAMDYEFILKALLKFKAVKVESNFGFYWFDGVNKSSTRNSRRDCRQVVIRHCMKNDPLALPVYLYDFYKSKAIERVDLWLARKGFK